MAINLNLPPDLELRIQQEAREQGMSLDDYAAQLLQNRLSLKPVHAESLWNRLTTEEWIKEFEAYLASHDPGQPPLPEEAYERASFYQV